MVMSSKSFWSVFAPYINDFIGLKRSLGYKYEVEERVLYRFDRFILDQGYTRNEAARSLGINSTMLGRWVTEHQSGDGQTFRGNGKLTPEQAEIRQLKEENRRLKMEKDILKKATVFFAKETR